jgi:hypothetical protein
MKAITTQPNFGFTLFHPCKDFVHILVRILWRSYNPRELSPLKCPDCGSSEIVSDLLLFSDEATIGQHPPYVKSVEPEPAKRPILWMPKTVMTGFRAAICGACGHTQFYTKYHAGILEAHKKGYSSQTYSLNIIPPP